MKMACFFVSPQGGWHLALTNDLSCIDYLTRLSNAQSEISYTNCIEYYTVVQCTIRNSMYKWHRVTQLSNARSKVPYTICVEYYSSINKKYNALSIVKPLLFLKRARNVKNKCIYDEKWMLHPSVLKLLLRIIDIVFSLLNRFGSDSVFFKLLLQTGRHSCYIGYDCLYLDRDLPHPCMVLYLKFRQSQYTKHDFIVLKR